MDPANPGRPDARWWVNETGDEKRDQKVRGERLANVVGAIYRAQEPLRQAQTVSWRLYSNQPIVGLSPRSYRMRAAGVRFNAMALNLAAAATDAYVALITKDEPRSFLDVTDADRTLKQRAKRLQRFVDGVKYETKFADTRDDVVAHCGIFGAGICKFFRDPNRSEPTIAIEARNQWNLLVDEQEAAAGKPPNLYELMWIDRGALMEQYPEQKEQIRTASSSPFLDQPASSASSPSLVDQVVAVEAWHLPRVFGKKGSRDGLRTLLVGNTVLEENEYKWNRFPFEWVYRKKPVQGIYGQGIPHEIAPMQLEINRLMRTINQGQRLSVGHWFVETNSDVNTNAINDIVASIIRWSGVKPEYICEPGVSQDVYQYLWMIWQKGFEELGISQMAAMAQKPPGLNASVAIDSYADVQSDRYKPAYRGYQSFDLRATEQIIHLARELSDEDPDFEVDSKEDAAMMKTVRWAVEGLRDDQFNLKIREINQLGDDVPSKMETVSEMTASGYIDSESGKRMLLEDGGMPDLAGYESLEAASYNFVEMCADAAICDAKYIKPIIYVDSIPLAIARMQRFYVKAQTDGVEDSRLRLMRQWMDECAKLPPPPAAPPPVMPPGPLGAGAPPGALPKPAGPPGLPSPVPPSPASPP